jgi:hypothetical protein
MITVWIQFHASVRLLTFVAQLPVAPSFALRTSLPTTRTLYYSKYVINLGVEYEGSAYSPTQLKWNIKWVPLCNTQNLQLILRVFYSHCFSVTPTAYVEEAIKNKRHLVICRYIKFCFSSIILYLVFENNFSIIPCDTYFILLFYFILFWVMWRSSILAQRKVKLDRYWAEWKRYILCLPT